MPRPTAGCGANSGRDLRWRDADVRLDPIQYFPGRITTAARRLVSARLSGQSSETTPAATCRRWESDSLPAILTPRDARFMVPADAGADDAAERELQLRRRFGSVARARGGADSQNATCSRRPVRTHPSHCTHCVGSVLYCPQSQHGSLGSQTPSEQVSGGLIEHRIPHPPQFRLSKLKSLQTPLV